MHTRMGYLHDFREELADELDPFELPDDARRAVLDLMSEKVLESYKNGLKAGATKARSSKKATSRREK